MTDDEARRELRIAESTIRRLTILLREARHRILNPQEPNRGLVMQIDRELDGDKGPSHD